MDLLKNLFWTKQHNKVPWIIPDDILTVILSYLKSYEQLKLIFVSQQFYYLIRPLLVQCYHIHHLLPRVRSIIQVKNNVQLYILYLNQQSINIYKLAFRVNISKEKIMDYFLQNTFHHTFNCVSFFDQLMNHLYYFDLNYYIINEEIKTYYINVGCHMSFQSFFDFEKIYLSINDDMINKIINVIKQYCQNILVKNERNYFQFKNDFIACFPDHIKLTIQCFFDKMIPDYVWPDVNRYFESHEGYYLESQLLEFSGKKQQDCVKQIKNIIDNHNKTINILDMNKTSLILDQGFFINPYVQLDQSLSTSHQWFLHKILQL